MTFRKTAALWLISLVVLCELAFLIDLLGVDIPRAGAVVGILFLGPLLTTAVLWRRVRFEMEDDAGMRWALIGIGTFALWASVYFVVGHLIPPERIGRLPTPVLSWLPVVPSFSLLYVAVHPFNLIPWFVLRRHHDLKRLFVAMAIMLAVSVVFWTAWPVATVRIDPPDGGATLGSWVLSLIYRFDPSANCFPSAHCSMAMCVALSTRQVSKRLGLWAILTCLLIALSTLFTHQHYLLDVLSGLSLGAAGWYAAERVLRMLPSRIWANA